MPIGNLGRPGHLGLTRGTGVPWWAAAKYQAIDTADGVSKRAAAIADFRRWRFAIITVAAGSISGASVAALGVMREATFAEWFAFASGGGTYIDASGVMQTAASNIPRRDWSTGVGRLALNNAATNLLLNSATLSTQSVTVSAVVYTLSFYGTGTVTRSGTSTGATTGTGTSVRTTVTFTPTAGTLTLTVTGSVTNAQLEAQSFASPYIPTTSSAVTRPIETAQFGAVTTALMQRSAATAVVRGKLTTANDYPRILGTNALSGYGGLIMGRPAQVACNTAGPDTLVTVAPTGWQASAFGAGISFDATGRALAGNGGAPGSAATLVNVGTAVYLGRDSMASIYADGFYDELIIFPFRVSNADLPRLAVPYA